MKRYMIWNPLRWSFSRSPRGFLASFTYVVASSGGHYRYWHSVKLRRKARVTYIGTGERGPELVILPKR